MMETVANILDPIHESLPRNVWDNAGAPEPKLKAQHAKWIRTTVERALTDAGYTHVASWLSLVLTGSLTTYQYSELSDCDISLFVDAEAFPEWSRADMIALMVKTCDGLYLPGTSYQMQFFVVARGLSKDQLYQHGLRAGYDIDHHEWISPPDRDRVHDVEREMAAQYAAGLEAADKMDRLLKFEPHMATIYWHQIHRRRMRDQKSGKGDFSDSNIIYKFLANRGLFPRIEEASGERIAKPIHRQVAKFVYDPINNHLVVGRTAAEEGEAESHYDIVHARNMDKLHGLRFGQVDQNGHVEVFSRPKIVGYGKAPMNQYEADWRLDQALKSSLPGAKMHLGTDLINPNWEADWTPPQIEFLYDRPIINATDQPPPQENVWDFEGPEAAVPRS